MTIKLIEQEKKNLVRLAERYGLNFQNHQVLVKSKEVDKLIVAQMRLKIIKQVV